MTNKHPFANVFGIFALLLSLLVLFGTMLLTPEEFRLTCTKDACRYITSNPIGMKTMSQFPLQAISNVWTQESHSRSGTAYYVYLTVAGKQLEVSQYNEQTDADALVERIRRFQSAPTEAPLENHMDKNGVLLSILSVSVGFSLTLGLIAWRRGSKKPG